MSTINTWAGINRVSWVPVLQKTITLGSHYKIVPTEGYLAWEYNPLRNYRLSLVMYEKDGKYYTVDQLTEILTNIAGTQVSLYKLDNSPKTEAELQADYGLATYNEFILYTLREAGELVDFITEQLKFNLSNPVEILPLYSYDGSVNLILNDGINIPRLINSRFTVTGKNTYKIIDRKGDNDTNIYDLGDLFDVDTSLFKNVNKIPVLDYIGTSSGNMPIGNYHFYFKYSDADGNESDWVAESGLVSLFIGNSPLSVNTGIRDENSVKSVRFKLSNIDIGYNYVKVYYTRYSADIDSNLIVQAKKIDKNFLVNNAGTCNILITGDENTTDVTLEEINSSFDIIQNAQTLCTAANRLFMANVHKSRVEYDLLAKLSLCFCPYKSEEVYPLTDLGIDCDYNITSKSDGYYDTKFIYDKTGYWPGELYRIGIVYILKDSSLSPVFNIRGATNIKPKPVIDPTDSLLNRPNYFAYHIDKLFNTYDASDEKVYKDINDILPLIEYSEEDYMIIGGEADNENAKGVIQLSQDIDSVKTPFPIFGLEIGADALVIDTLKQYVKGFFFVRLKRIPLTLALGIVVGIDNESRTPTLPTMGGVITDIDHENSFVESSDVNYVNYVSEGFLSRYKFTIEPTAENFWIKFAKIAAAVVVLAAAVVATVFTCGAAGVALGAGLGAAVVSGGALLGSATAVAGISIGGAIAIGAGCGVAAGAIAVGIEAGVTKAKQNITRAEAIVARGRNEDIPDHYERKETPESRQLIQSIADRYIIKDGSKNSTEALIVPDYQVNQPYYNLLFTGDDFTVKLTYELPITNHTDAGYFDSELRHFYTSGYNLFNVNTSLLVKLVGVPDSCPAKLIGSSVYKARAGYPEEAYKYEFVGMEYDSSLNKRDNSDIIRGNFGSFVGMQGYRGNTTDLVNIMIPGYLENKLFEYVLLRAQDTSAFYAISDRIDINTINKSSSILAENAYEQLPYSQTFYRGDCYICQYTHRIIRNFNDPSAPYNDKVVDLNSWKDNYDPDKPENFANINLGDVNAIQLGLWLTFLLRSSYNLNIRTVDKSNVDEHLMCGNYRSFYPYYGLVAFGAQKIPDSDLYNKGFSKSVSEKYYFEVPDIPYIKQEFQNRIVFSDIHINDAYKNGFRVLRSTNHKDYPMTHGSITKLIEIQNALYVVFEHGVGLITINNLAEHPSLILSDVQMLSDMYGSQWKDSIIKTPGGVYGVDTVAKKIWRIKDGKFELISDFRVQEFLNQNITLSERELTPTLGIRNVKTTYNAFKQDVMFTFYDNLYGIHEKAWNLCWNEVLEMFVTFYSWIPSEMLNIDNIPFSFDRDTVKAISKLGVSDHGNDFSDGVTLSNNVLNVNYSGFSVNNKELKIPYYDKAGVLQYFEFTNLATQMADPDFTGFVGFLYLDNRLLLDKKTQYEIHYELLRDNLGNHKLFSIKHKSLPVTPVYELLKGDTLTTSVDVWYLTIDPAKAPELLSEIYYRNSAGKSHADVILNKVEPTPIKDAAGVITGYTIHLGKPIFKNKAGKRLMLEPELQINPGKIVRYLNIKANVKIGSSLTTVSPTEAYYSLITSGGSLIDAGYFESQVAVTTTHNLSLLSTDFWKHGLAGIIDIADKIYPTLWYGKQHPFEFECVVVNDPSIHKVFTNLELVANKTKPESFHYEVVGDVYDFADDKPTMYFRLEALKALYQYNGYDIEYNPNFLEIQPIQHNRSADLPKYYSRWDTINDIYDHYKRHNAPGGFDYDHLSGAEIVYYPTRNEFRVWNHVEAIDADSKYINKKGMLVETSVIKANCRYLEDKWVVSINPIIVTYKNEFNKAFADLMFLKDASGAYYHSTWVDADPAGPFSGSKLPPINFKGTRMEQELSGGIQYPGDSSNPDAGKDNALYELYNVVKWNLGDWSPIDPTGYTDRRETDVRGKFMKVRIRYSGEELAIIDFLNTIYQISYA